MLLSAHANMGHMTHNILLNFFLFFFFVAVLLSQCSKRSGMSVRSQPNSLDYRTQWTRLPTTFLLTKQKTGLTIKSSTNHPNHHCHQCFLDQHHHHLNHHLCHHIHHLHHHHHHHHQCCLNHHQHHHHHHHQTHLQVRSSEHCFFADLWKSVFFSSFLIHIKRFRMV